MNSFYNSFDSIEETETETDPNLQDDTLNSTQQPEITKCVALYSYEVRWLKLLGMKPGP